MEAGVSDRVWNIEEIVALMDEKIEMSRLSA
jgi:hypothetical protein